MPKKYLLGLFLIIILMGFPLFTSSIFQFYSSKKSIEVNKVVKIPYLQQSNKKITLLFFGYVGCEDVCSPFLYQLKDLYHNDKWSNIKPNIEVVFVNLIPSFDPETPMLYVNSIDKDFNGVYLDGVELRSIEKEFRLSFSPSIFNSQEVNHSDYLYLIVNDKERILKKMYMTKQLDKEQLYEDIVTNISKL